MTVMTQMELYKNLYEVINDILKYDDVVQVSGKEGNVVMLSEVKYRGMLETMYLYSQPGVVDEILEAIKEPWEDGVVLDGGRLN